MTLFSVRIIVTSFVFLKQEQLLKQKIQITFFIFWKIKEFIRTNNIIYIYKN